MISSEEPRSADALLRFEWAVRALAQDAPTQIALFPSFTVIADELALDFEQCHQALGDALSELSDEVSAHISDLDGALAAISGPAHLELWTDDALRNAAEWVEIRSLATRVLQAAEWTTAPPPANRATYVGGDA